MRFKLNSVFLNYAVLSITTDRWVGSSSALKVTESSGVASLKTLFKFDMLIPNVIALSDLYDSNPSTLSYKETRATCDESIAYNDIPVGVVSILTSYTKSLIDSIIFFKVSAFLNLASNISFLYKY